MKNFLANLLEISFINLELRAAQVSLMKLKKKTRVAKHLPLKFLVKQLALNKSEGEGAFETDACFYDFRIYEL